MKEYNVYISNFSLVSSYRKNNYVDCNKDTYEGYTTNEAPIHSFIKRMKGNVNQIICIESNKVRNTNIDARPLGLDKMYKEGLSVEKYNKIRIRNSLKAEGINVEFKQKSEEDGKYIQLEKKEVVNGKEIREVINTDIFIEDEPNEKDVSNAAFQIYQILKSKAIEDPERIVHIYIEANGGVRYVLVILLSVIRVLEQQFDNVIVEEIMSMVYAPAGSSEPITIINSKNVYNAAQITDIVNEFSTYGRIKGLRKLFEERKGEFDLNSKTESAEREQIERLLARLEKTSADLQLCRTALILKDFYGDPSARIEYDKKSLLELIRDFSREKNHKSAITQYFSYIFQIFDGELTPIYEGYETANVTTNSIIFLPNIIRWCLEKDFYQQALTFSVERFPEYIFESEKVKLCPKRANSDSTHKYEITREMVEDRKKDDKTNELYEFYYYLITRLCSDFINNKPDICFLKGVEKKLYEDRSLISNSDFRNAISSSEWTDRYKDYTSTGSEVVENGTGEIRACLEGLFSNGISGCPVWIDLDKEFKISNKNKATVRSLSNNTPTNIDGNPIGDLNKAYRCMMESIIREYYIKKAPGSDKSIKEFKAILNSLKDESGLMDEYINWIENNTLWEDVQNYYIKDALVNRELLIKDGEEMNFQKFFYLYRLCKEQRNISNHANTCENQYPVKLEELKRLIEELLNTATGMEKCSP